jgi:alkylated DNA repair dioxygenase AlkB
MNQAHLFESVSDLPPGFRYEREFLTHTEEAGLLELIATLPLAPAEYKQFTARRRIVSYGGRYDFNRSRMQPAEGIPASLHPLRQRIADWVGAPADRFTYAVVTEYSTGTQLGWHRDLPDFEIVVGVSLAGPARMRFRPYPPQRGSRTKSIALELEPRSIYSMQGPARWGWQHCIAPTKNLRYSITFRTPRRSNQNS